MKTKTVELASLVRTEEGTPTVNARELHAFLQSGTKFATWISERIKECRFLENQDYVTFSVKTEKGRPLKEYHLSMDAAKHLSMLEKNDMGHQARCYFIECEKRLHQVRDALDSIPMDQLISSLQRRIWDSSVQAGLLQKLLPKGEYGDPAPNGQPRNGFRRSAWVAAPSRNTTAKELMKQLIMVEMLEELSHLGLGA